MYAIYGNIDHQYTPNVSIYTSTMDPMGMLPYDFPRRYADGNGNVPTGPVSLHPS